MAQGKFIDRTGEKGIMNCGIEVEIIRYKNNTDIDVLVLSTGEVIQHRRYGDFKRGKIRPSNVKTIHGWGIIDCKAVDEYGKTLKSFDTWRSMIQRTKDLKFKEKNKAYKDADCCDEWQYYSNFKKWYDESWYDVNTGDRMCLDKDILTKGNKLYSPETCIIVPEPINILFTYKRGLDNGLPCGIYYDKSRDKYVAQIQSNNKNMNLGRFNTPEEAFYTYKEAKEKEIKRVADLYKDKIPQKLYNAMYNYEIEITD